MITNTEWRKGTLSLIAAVFFTALCLVSYTSIDGMNGGYALAFISFFLGVSCFAVTLLFVHHARVMDAILADPSPLAHWTYPEEMVRNHVEREYRDYRERNRAMFIIIGGMLVAVSLFFLIFVRDGGLETGLFLLAFAALLFIISRVMPWFERQRAMNAPREAYIAGAGIIHEGAVYPFRSFLIFWDGVSLRSADNKDTARLVFSFTQLVGRFIVQPFDVIIPVPPGEEEKALGIVRDLSGERVKSTE